MQLSKQVIPLSSAMCILADSSHKRKNQSVYWHPQSRILWAEQDTRQAMMLAKISDPFSLDCLPPYPAALIHERGQIIRVERTDKASEITDRYRAFIADIGDTLQDYDCNGEQGRAFSRDIRELTEGRITVKVQAFYSTLSCDRLSIKTGGIHIMKNGEWQAFIKNRKLLHFRPSQKARGVSVLTPRSPEIP